MRRGRHRNAVTARGDRTFAGAALFSTLAGGAASEEYVVCAGPMARVVADSRYIDQHHCDR